MWTLVTSLYTPETYYNLFERSQNIFSTDLLGFIVEINERFSQLKSRNKPGLTSKNVGYNPKYSYFINQHYQSMFLF